MYFIVVKTFFAFGVYLIGLNMYVTVHLTYNIVDVTYFKIIGLFLSVFDMCSDDNYVLH